MNKQPLIFKRENKAGWEAIKSNLIHKVNEQIGIADKDFQVTIEPYKKKRSGQQLKGYWVLVKAIQVWMIEQGNLYLQNKGTVYNMSNRDDVSDWIKAEAGFFERKEIPVKVVINKNFYPLTSSVTKNIPKSIANNSDCTREDMKKIIDWILAFAAEFSIADCFIEDQELNNLLKSYSRN